MKTLEGPHQVGNYVNGFWFKERGLVTATNMKMEMYRDVKEKRDGLMHMGEIIYYDGLEIVLKEVVSMKCLIQPMEEDHVVEAKHDDALDNLFQIFEPKEKDQ